MSIQIEYMYRDASNYKQYESVVLPGNLTNEQLAQLNSDGDIAFIPSQIGLWDLQERWGGRMYEDDHVWHEFVEAERVDREPTVLHPTAEEFYEAVTTRTDQNGGWDVVAAMEANGIAEPGATAFIEKLRNAPADEWPEMVRIYLGLSDQ